MKRLDFNQDFQPKDFPRDLCQENPSLICHYPSISGLGWLSFAVAWASFTYERAFSFPRLFLIAPFCNTTFQQNIMGEINNSYTTLTQFRFNLVPLVNTCSDHFYPPPRPVIPRFTFNSYRFSGA